MIASATPEQDSRAVEIAGANPNTDALILVYLPPQLHSPADMIKAVKEAVERVPLEKPVLGVFMSSRSVPLLICDPPRGRIPLYGFPENAAVALSAAYRYAAWRKRPKGATATLDPRARREIRAAIDRVLACAGGPVWIEPVDPASVLRAAGIEFAAADLPKLPATRTVENRTAVCGATLS
jgi:acyl-CoA synthetase (NDP forming)